VDTTLYQHESRFQERPAFFRSFLSACLIEIPKDHHHHPKKDFRVLHCEWAGFFLTFIMGSRATKIEIPSGRLLLFAIGNDYCTRMAFKRIGGTEFSLSTCLSAWAGTGRLNGSNGARGKDESF
jgi:hypothetical protein